MSGMCPCLKAQPFLLSMHYLHFCMTYLLLNNPKTNEQHHPCSNNASILSHILLRQTCVHTTQLKDATLFRCPMTRADILKREVRNNLESVSALNLLYGLFVKERYSPSPAAWTHSAPHNPDSSLSQSRTAQYIHRRRAH